MKASDRFSLRAYASSLVSSAVTAIFRMQVEEFLARGIRAGSLTLTHPDGSQVIFGETAAAAAVAARPVATVHLLNPPAFFARVATQADIGFAEAYMAADFDVDAPAQLVALFHILVLNRDADNALSSAHLVLSKLGAAFNSALHVLNRNTLAGSRRNIKAHYDLSNEMFATFLGDTWTYSCAIFAPGRSLADAQIAKIDAILAKARINSSHHLLEVGCGWGELAIRAVKTTGCRVKAITLSDEQLSLARHRADEADVSHAIDFELVDYRDLLARGAQYDRIVSVEMAEAVGHEFLPQYFASLDALLKPHGVIVIQVITTPEQRYETYRTSTDFIQKHIFPGGICPSLEAMVGAIAKHTQLVIEHVENIGVHYATTLAEWRRRFLESVKTGAVRKAGFDDAFVRKFVYYFSYCESGFATRTLGDLQIVLTRVNNTSAFGGPLLCGDTISDTPACIN